jgi:hypothetical protein
MLGNPYDPRTPPEPDAITQAVAEPGAQEIAEAWLEDEERTPGCYAMWQRLLGYRREPIENEHAEEAAEFALTTYCKHSLGWEHITRVLETHYPAEYARIVEGLRREYGERVRSGVEDGV